MRCLKLGSQPRPHIGCAQRFSPPCGLVHKQWQPPKQERFAIENVHFIMVASFIDIGMPQNALILSCTICNNIPGEINLLRILRLQQLIRETAVQASIQAHANGEQNGGSFVEIAWIPSAYALAPNLQQRMTGLNLVSNGWWVRFGWFLAAGSKPWPFPIAI